MLDGLKLLQLSSGLSAQPLERLQRDSAELQSARLPGQLLEGPGASFRELLDDSLRTNGGVKFSAHALQRLESRGIALEAGQVQALEGAVQQAADKGSRESLVLAERFALLVNVPSKTVITALDQQGLRDGVVTNIDSAVWLGS
jgi:flagellar operon protein